MCMCTYVCARTRLFAFPLVQEWTFSVTREPSESGLESLGEELCREKAIKVK